MDTSVPALPALAAVLSPLLGQQQQPSGALLSPTQPLLTQQQPTASAGAPVAGVPVAATQQLQPGASSASSANNTRTTLFGSRITSNR